MTLDYSAANAEVDFSLMEVYVIYVKIHVLSVAKVVLTARFAIKHLREYLKMEHVNVWKALRIWDLAVFLQIIIILEQHAPTKSSGRNQLNPANHAALIAGHVKRKQIHV